MFDGLSSQIEAGRIQIAPVRVRFGRVRWTVRSPSILDGIQHVLRDPDAFLADPGLLLRDTFRVTIGRVRLQVAGHENWILRRNNYGSTSAVVRDFFRRSAPIRAFQSGLTFASAGIPTPPVLAAGIVRVLQRPVVGYLLVAEISPAVTLMQYFKQHGDLPHLVLKRSAGSIAQMHDRGILHGDLNIQNILLDDQSHPWLIDLERARSLRHSAGWRDTIEDVFRLTPQIEELGPVAVTSGLRFLEYYCQFRGWQGKERECAIAILTRVRRIVRAAAKR